MVLVPLHRFDLIFYYYLSYFHFGVFWAYKKKKEKESSSLTVFIRYSFYEVFSMEISFALSFFGVSVTLLLVFTKILSAGIEPATFGFETSSSLLHYYDFCDAFILFLFRRVVYRFWLPSGYKKVARVG